MFRLLRKWFGASKFHKAKRWAKSQPHPFLNNLSLWDYVHNNWIDPEHKLHQINKKKNGRTIR